MDVASSAALKSKSKPSMLPSDRRAMQGVWLLLAALGVFFFSSILLYVVYVAMRTEPMLGGKSQPLFLPRSFVPSTVFLIGVSFFLEIALYAARRDRDALLKSSTIIACFMGIFFMVAQSEGMYQLINSTANVISAKKSAYAFTFVLALLHALHVLAGMVGLLITAMQASREKYDHERNFGIRFCAIYWHFLDIVWVVLLIAFIIAGRYLRVTADGGFWF